MGPWGSESSLPGCHSARKCHHLRCLRKDGLPSWEEVTGEESVIRGKFPKQQMDGLTYHLAEGSSQGLPALRAHQDVSFGGSPTPRTTVPFFPALHSTHVRLPLGFAWDLPPPTEPSHPPFMSQIKGDPHPNYILF